MKEFTPKKVFILHNGEYREITLEEHLDRREKDEEYQGRKFIALHGMIMEVSLKDYLAFYRARRRQKYLAETAAERGDVSYDALTTDEFNGEDVLIDPDEDIAEKLAWQQTLDMLRFIIHTLPEDEKELIIAHQSTDNVQRINKTVSEIILYTDLTVGITLLNGQFIGKEHTNGTTADG